MNPELQTVVGRIEMLERQNGTLRMIAMLALLVSIGFGVMMLMQSSRKAEPADTVGRFSSIEANRIILRDLDSRAAGGLEVDRNGTIRLVLGRTGEGGAVVVEAQRNGIAHVTLRDAQGVVRAGIVGSDQPTFALGGKPESPAITMLAASDGSGRIAVHDARGRVRFRAP